MRKPLNFVISLLLQLSLAVSVTAYVPHYTEEKDSLKLRWKNNLIKIALSNSLIKSGPNVKPESDIAGAIQRSLAVWENAADIKFEIVWTDKQTVSPNGNFGDAVSLITIAQTTENLLMFSKDSEDVSARTRVFFNKKGIITEADIVLNPYQQFSTDGSIGTFDFESTLTHEIGHLLGLEHSSVFSATMHENNGKNGVFNLASFVSRTLADTDITAIRAIYGAKPENENCCGAIAGKLTSANSKTPKTYAVWAESAETGRVVAEVKTSAEGVFRLEGLAEGSYHIYGQNTAVEKTIFAAEEIAKVEVISGKTLALAKRMNDLPTKLDLQYVGFNGQLSELSVPLNAGKSYLVYIGGKNLDPKNVKVAFNTAYLSVTPKSLMKHDYGENVSVLSFEVKVNAKIAAGEYSILVESANGLSRHIIGGLTVEEFANPWNSNILLED